MAFIIGLSVVTQSIAETAQNSHLPTVVHNWSVIIIIMFQAVKTVELVRTVHRGSSRGPPPPF